MTAIEKIKKINIEIASLKGVAIDELQDMIRKANSLVTEELIEEIQENLEEYVGGPLLTVDYQALAKDGDSSDNYTIMYSLCYNVDGRISVYKGLAHDFDGRLTSIGEAVSEASIRDIEFMYVLLEKLIDSLGRGILMYEI